MNGGVIMARNKPELEEIGSQCAVYRRRVLGLTQRIVAEDVGVSVPLVSMFERGYNDSARLLWWYIQHGFQPHGAGKYFFGRRGV